MIYKRCSLCHNRIPEGTTCACYERKRKKSVPSVNEFYNTELWRSCKDKAKAKTFGLDPISFVAEHKLEYGQTVHHIYPLKDFPERKADLDNLIYITEKHHRLIHEAYKADQKNVIIWIYKILNIFEQNINSCRGGTLEILNKGDPTPLPSFLFTKF